jgi:hypothetical protein
MNSAYDQKSARVCVSDLPECEYEECRDEITRAELTLLDVIHGVAKITHQLMHTHAHREIQTASNEKAREEPEQK